MIYLIVLFIWILFGAYWAHRTEYFFPNGDEPLLDEIIDRIICLPFLIVFGTILLFWLWINN